MSKCACGSQKDFSSCCEPILKGKVKAPTAESLMRARYCAFTTADIDFIEKSTDPSTRESFDRDGTLEWANNSTWNGLEIVSTAKGTDKDTIGEVEFIARYKYQDVDREHHERSIFKKRDGEWFFFDGKLVQAPVRNENKIGRNDPCSCGSGKKYKKCCGSAA